MGRTAVARAHRERRSREECELEYAATAAEQVRAHGATVGFAGAGALRAKRIHCAVWPAGRASDFGDAHIQHGSPILLCNTDS